MGKRKLALTTIAPTALIHPTARIGKGTRVWAFAQVAEHASIGKYCVIGNGVYVDRYVKIGSHVWIQNKALIYQGTIVEDHVFIGPGVCFTNDKYPRSGIRRNLKNIWWTIGKGTSVGANAVILPNIFIGPNAFVAAGAVVTKNVPAHVLVAGNPARVVIPVCSCGKPWGELLEKKPKKCPACGHRIKTRFLKDIRKHFSNE